MNNINDLITALNLKGIQTTALINPRGNALELDYIYARQSKTALLLYHSNVNMVTVEISSGYQVDPENIAILGRFLRDVGSDLWYRRWTILDTGYYVLQATLYSDDVDTLAGIIVCHLDWMGSEFSIVAPYIEEVVRGFKTVDEAKNDLYKLGMLK